ncbi:MAG: hypothetical protein JW993_03045 [Sedimentisphaerales bacterium]|nr:hypothetical protein [Sedimentisphaerales bacterium]
MTNLIDLRLGGTANVAVGASSSRRLLPGGALAEEPIRVDVRVRSYDEAPLAPRTLTLVPKDGTLPIGTLLDCYL